MSIKVGLGNISFYNVICLEKINRAFLGENRTHFTIEQGKKGPWKYWIASKSKNYYTWRI